MRNREISWRWFFLAASNTPFHERHIKDYHIYVIDYIYVDNHIKVFFFLIISIIVDRSMMFQNLRNRFFKSASYVLVSKFKILSDFFGNVFFFRTNL